MRNILLFSSGKDSVLSLFRLAAEDCATLKKVADLELHHVDYGQYASFAEIKILKYYAKKFSIPYKLHTFKFFNLPEAVLGNAESNEKNVTVRNTLLAMYVIQKEYKTGTPLTLWLGCPKELEHCDGDAYFVEKLNALTNSCYPEIFIDSAIKDIEANEVWEELILTWKSPKVMVCYSMKGSEKGFGLKKSSSFLNCGKCWKCRYSILQLRQVFGDVSENEYAIKDYLKIAN